MQHKTWKENIKLQNIKPGLVLAYGIPEHHKLEAKDVRD